ncbi:DNA repair protein RecO [Candidatus Daviesbacteria bacterium]|nr:DNA repair protein RecO [Candidatus Daviesbacteria bacterium]
MRGLKVEGIIVKRRNLGEADRILTVFTLRKGKISVLAKGVRRITSRRSGNVELLNRSLMYLHQGKGMPILTEATTLDTYAELKMDLTLSTYAYHLIELVDKLTAENILSLKDYFTPQNQENRILYEHLKEVLKRLVKNPRQIFIRAFEAKILSNLGFLSFQQSSGTNLGKNPQVSRFASEARRAIQIHPKGVHALLGELEILSWDEIEKMKVSEKEAMELERILRYHVERVIEGSLKSRQFLKKL